MEEFKNRLRTAMDMRRLRPTDLSERTGLSKARISQYMNGKYRPKPPALLALAEALGVTEAWLFGKPGAAMLPDQTPSFPTDTPSRETGGEALRKTGRETDREADSLDILHLRRYPMLGEIACGVPILAEEDRDGGFVTGVDTHADFCLTAKGDSMIGARIYEGDEVFIQQTDMVDNGEIAAVVVDNEATLKRVYYYPDEQKLVLSPENPAYQPLVFTGEELNHIRILGRAVAFQGKIR